VNKWVSIRCDLESDHGNEPGFKISAKINFAKGNGLVITSCFLYEIRKNIENGIFIRHKIAVNLRMIYSVV
jgi:hypothetical protein